MYWHGPNCLGGPVSWQRNRDSGAGANVLGAYAGPETPDGDEEVRTDLVERVRREIAEGVYETPEKWQAALERLLERLEE